MNSNTVALKSLAGRLLAAQNRAILLRSMHQMATRAMSTTMSSPLVRQLLFDNSASWSQRRQLQTIAQEGQDWSGGLSFTSPESDFSTSSFPSGSTNTKDGTSVWSGLLSFASPEADFTSQVDVGLVHRMMHEDANRATQKQPQHAEQKTTWSNSLSFTSPESDFTSTKDFEIEHREEEKFKEDFIHHVQSDDHYRNTMAYSLSFASPEADFTSPNILDLLDDRMKKQLHNSTAQLMEYDRRRELLKAAEEEKKQLSEEQYDLENEEYHSFSEVYKTMDTMPLPQTLSEALNPKEQRAIVITESVAPFRIVDVNDAWVGLCGYTREESRGKTLASLLQGPETDRGAITDMMEELLKGHESGTVITNYAKGGRKFQNRLRVGHLMMDQQQKEAARVREYFVGVLREINEMGDHYTTASQAMGS